MTDVTDLAAATSAPPLGASDRARVVVPFVIVTLIWSSTWLVIRGQLGIVPPAWSITYRFAIATVAMMLFAWRTRVDMRLTRRQHGFALAYGIAQYALNYYATYLAERSLTSGLVAVAFALLVVPNALFGWIFLRQRVSRPFLIGSAVALVGMGFLFGHELHAGTAPEHEIAIGILWALAAILFSSVANVMQATERARSVPLIALVAWGMAWGTGFDLLVALATSGPPVFDPSPAYWLGTIYLGVLGSSLAFTLYFGVIRAIGPARAAYSSVMTPVLAMLLSTVFEGYRWSLSAVLGVVLALAGLVVALRAKAR
jgi:drug/metabolite transporter (DMT)-like permease